MILILSSDDYSDDGDDDDDDGNVDQEPDLLVCTLHSDSDHLQRTCRLSDSEWINC